MNIRTLTVAATAGLASLTGLMPQSCGPELTPDANAPAVSQEDPACNNVIRWEGRGPVKAVDANDNNEQRLLDQGKVTSTGSENYAHVSGHFSTHGAVFRSGPSLQNGSWIEWDCSYYTVTGRGSGRPGNSFVLPRGLTVQYSGCGGVCFVFAVKS